MLNGNVTTDFGVGVKDLATVCSICNQSSVDFKDGKYVKIGEPTEAALVVLGMFFLMDLILKIYLFENELFIIHTY